MNLRTTLPLLALAAAAALPAVAQAAPETQIVSRGSDGAPSADGAATPVVSADGRFTAFASGADELSPVDDDSVVNVFLRDRATGATQLVSRNGAVPANGDSSEPDISADGRFVAFTSAATNLSADDATATAADVYLFDAQSGTVQLVSRANGIAGGGALAAAWDPSISDDGHRIAFVSQADNLSPFDVDSVDNLYVRDVIAGTTEYVSRGAAAADAESSEPAISGNGKVVAFASDAVLAGDGMAEDIFTRDLETDTTQLISRRTGLAGPFANGNSHNPSISADGRYVAFDTGADNLVDDDVDLVNRRVLRRDRLSNTTILVSRATGNNGAANTDFAGWPSISANGGLVAFQSAPPLTADADPAVRNVYVRQIVGGVTTLASRASGDDGAAANADAVLPDLSADGQTVVFGSAATNLAPGPYPAGQAFARGPAIAAILPPASGGGGGTGAPEPVVVPPSGSDAGPVLPATVGSTSTSPTPTGSTRAPIVRLRLLTVGQRTVRVRVSCPSTAAGACRGSLTLRGAGQRRFGIGRGHSRVVTVRLGRRARTAMAHSRSRSARFTAVVRVRAADSPVRVQKQRLRGPRRQA